jgi:hypothetical protein
MMKNETMLHDEIKAELEELSKLEVGSDEYETAVNGISKLMDRAIEMEKFESDAKERIDSKEAELDLKYRQLEEDIKDRKTRNKINIAGIVIPAGITIWGTIKTLKFDQNNIITSTAGKEFTRKIFNMFKK